MSELHMHAWSSSLAQALCHAKINVLTLNWGSFLTSA